MTTEELLLELRDIQPPAEPGWWLLAPAWLIALGLMLGLLAFSWLLYRRRRRHRMLLEARQGLRSIRRDYHRTQNLRITLQQLSAWLRQVAMAAFPDRQVPVLTGPAWIDFLNQCSNSKIFDREMLRILTEDIYRDEIQADADRAIATCETWLIAVSDKLRYHGKRHAGT